MKLTKYFSVVVLLILALLLTTFSFAYWAGEVNVLHLMTMKTLFK